MKAKSLLTISLLHLLLQGAALAEVNEYQGTVQKKAARQSQPAWRNSLVVYENIVSALSLNKGAEQSWNPYYAQSFSFRPRYYFRDDLSLRARLDLELELTTSDAYRKHEWILSDTSFDLVYSSRLLTIPAVGVQVSPGLRVAFPTSKASRGRSLLLSAGPGFSLRRSFALLQGRFFKSLGLSYGFRGTKYFHRYTTAQVGDAVCGLGAGQLTNPACLHSGRRNVSWRLSNLFELRLQLMEKLSFTADLMLLNDLLHSGSAAQFEDGSGSPALTFDETRINHRASVMALFDLSYDLLDWLWLSLGVSTFYPQLADDSTLRSPIFNRYTTFYFDVAVPVDRLAAQIGKWAGKGGQR